LQYSFCLKLVLSEKCTTNVNTKFFLLSFCSLSGLYERPYQKTSHYTYVCQLPIVALWPCYCRDHHRFLFQRHGAIYVSGEIRGYCPISLLNSCTPLPSGYNSSTTRKSSFSRRSFSKSGIDSKDARISFSGLKSVL